VVSRIDELRHLDGLKVTLGVSDIEAVAMAPTLSTDVREMQFIQSDSESVVGYKQLIFETLWKRAIPAASRIAQLENGTGMCEKSDVKLKNPIHSIFICRDCGESFIFSDEVSYHGDSSGHSNFKELPLF
jgi:hypothetical protein